jgi:hypothetical protein
MERSEIIDSQLKYAKDVLDADLESNMIDDVEYSRGIINLSYEYGLLGQFDDSLLMFINIKEDYFINSAPSDMEDPDLYSKCNFLFEVFDYMGLVPFDLLCTQAVAKA